MGFFDRFKKKQEPDETFDSLTDLSLRNMKAGFMVDYDLQTWTVKAANKYDFGGDVSLEWQLESATETLYLQLEHDDEDAWSLSRSVPFGKLGGAIKKAIIEDGDPPEEVEFDGETYYMEETAGGYFFANGQSNPAAQRQEMLLWEYSNDAGDKYLTIEQWGEQEFQASIGWPVEEFQFANILPGA